MIKQSIISLISMLLFHSVAQATSLDIELSENIVRTNIAEITKAFEELETSLILIGERHNNRLSRRLIAHSMSAISTGDNKLCYFSEEDETFQEAFNHLPHNQTEAARIHNEIYKNHVGQIGDVMRFSPSGWTDFTNLSLIASAGYSVLAIDSITDEERAKRLLALMDKVRSGTASADEGAEFNYLFLGPRNIVMAEAINKAFTDRKCDFGILVVGKAHLYSTQIHEDYPISSLENLINIPHKTVNVEECQRLDQCQLGNWADLNISIVREI